jgi:fatty-acyl-CoA synthase
MNATGNWLAMHARFQPSAEAVYDATSGRRWTYAQLHHDARCWAGRLRDRGVGHGDRVALLAHNCGETFALLFACAELGAILFPMNWRLSSAELAWQLGNAEPAVAITDAAFGPMIPGALALEDGPGAVAIDGPGAELSDPWVLMYTSGSSGKPKGALLTHGQLHWNAVNTILACDLARADATLTFTPLFHTGGLHCLSTPLLHRGGRVVVTRGVDPAEALRLIVAERITLLMGVPTIYQMLADHPAFDASDVSSVRDALCGGQALSAPLLERYLDRGIPLRQGFGMTEVGPNCFSMPHRSIREKLGSVGLPIHHVAMRITRPDGTEAAADEPGELWMRGPAVFGGYFRDPAATAAAFDGPWFRTGDVLSRDADGFFHVRGRLKEMYKSGGENVYPAEVEAILQEHPAVAHAAVIGVLDPKWGEVGVAFVEARPGAAVEADAVRGFLDGRLARFKHPKRIVIGELPRTASGKIDKVALRAGASA